MTGEKSEVRTSGSSRPHIWPLAYLFTLWAGRLSPWHGAVEWPVWRSAAAAVRWPYPEERRLARPSSSLAAP